MLIIFRLRASPYSFKANLDKISQPTVAICLVNIVNEHRSCVDWAKSILNLYFLINGQLVKWIQQGEGKFQMD